MMLNVSFCHGGRDVTGANITLREKCNKHGEKYVLTVEFGKHQDCNLGFHYYTSSHDHFYKGLQPHLDEKTSQKKHQKRHKRREQPVNLMIGRTSLPTPGSCSV